MCEDRDQQSGPLKELENVLDFDAMTSGDYFHEFLKRKQKKVSLLVEQTTVLHNFNY